MSAYIEITKHSDKGDFLSNWQRKGHYSWFLYIDTGDLSRIVIRNNGSFAHLEATLDEIRTFLVFIKPPVEVYACKSPNSQISGRLLFSTKAA